MSKRIIFLIIAIGGIFILVSQSGHNIVNNVAKTGDSPITQIANTVNNAVNNQQDKQIKQNEKTNLGQYVNNESQKTANNMGGTQAQKNQFAKDMATSSSISIWDNSPMGKFWTDVVSKVKNAFGW